MCFYAVLPAINKCASPMSIHSCVSLEYVQSTYQISEGRAHQCDDILALDKDTTGDKARVSAHGE